jgi:predicted acylesterase/phospholipase RssA/cellulose biosynthesis protein BcsQ
MTPFTVTFYSFKGGVGRSMALANLGECFYDKGLRVLVLDWDLEAPGVETYFYPPESRQSPGADLTRVRSHPGLIDMLRDYKQVFPSLPQMWGPEPPVPADLTEDQKERQRQVEMAADIARKFLDTQDLPDALRRVEVPPLATPGVPRPAFPELLDKTLPAIETYLQPVHSSGGAVLWLLTAGARRDGSFAEYAAAVQDFDWLEFYAVFEGKAYFDWLRAKLEAVADVVLIDSRTGVTEMGGVCTRQMADAVVAFCAPNFQNIDGVARIVDSLDGTAARKARGDRSLEVLVVPTRIDNSESDRLGEFSESFRDRLEKNRRLPDRLKGLPRPMWNLRIPYVPRFNYLEQRVVGPGIAPTDPPSQDLQVAYRKIAAHLAVLAPTASPLFQRHADEIAHYLPQLRADVLVVCPRAAAEGARLRHVLTSHGLLTLPDLEPSDADYRVQVDRAGVLIVMLTSDAPAHAGLRRAVQYARQQGKPVHLVAAGEPGQVERPPWARRMMIQPLEPLDRLLKALATPPSAARVPFMAPALGPGIIARSELYGRLRELVRMPSSPVVVLSGPPGSGKSTLAAQLCHDDEAMERFPDGVLWLELGPAPDMAAKWRELYLALFGPEGAPTDPDEVRRAVNARLESGQFLVVLVDCESAERRDLPQPGPGGALVLTTIRREAARPTEATIVVGDLTQAESVRLLMGATGVSSEAAHLLLEKLGTSPLVTGLAGDVLARAADPASAVADVQERASRQGVVAFDEAGSTERARSVARAVRTSLMLLDQADRPLLFALAESTAATFSLADAVALLKVSEARARSLLDRLDALYFLSFDAATGRCAWPTTSAAWRYFRQRPNVPARAHAGERHQMSSGDWKTNRDVAAAIELIHLRRRMSHEDLFALAKTLKDARYFDLARLLLVLARQALPSSADPARSVLYAQQQALCTYKNSQAPVDERLDEALSILREHAALDTTTSPETLGIAGAIYKERWKYDGQRANLERALAHYLRGSEAGVAADHGYTAINAAFVLDLVADEEQRNDLGAALAGRREQARALRERIVAELPSHATADPSLRSQWWFLVTLGEAHFGLGAYDRALYWLKEALLTLFSEWEYEATARQLATLLVLAERRGEAPDALLAAQETLRLFLGNDAAVVGSVRLGKVGLALSGGGFRAALFHVGVLARLAELDFLRHVEVLSCVSGGSIIGAHYYLELRKLLQDKPDHRITRQDYVDIVKRIEADFLAGVQRNVRTRAAANWWANMKTAVVPGYSRTNRVGELYESEIYARVTDGETGPRYVNRLTIQPREERSDFSPKLDNWRRSAKAPVLVLNATTLNTGHNWQFTITWMGEPPSAIVSEVDANERFRRLYYWQAPPRHRDVRLGYAVAASSCVPGLFEPLALHGLYPERTVQLVDGGVQDNQGTSSLIEQECTVMLVSDASGQMSTIHHPSPEVLSVPLRANSILQARVRESEFLDLHARRQSSLLRGLLFVHLKKDLDADSIGWIGDEPPARRGAAPVTPYGIDATVQAQLAAIRTDLDSFHDSEAAALMLSGYAMTERYFRSAVPHAVVPADAEREAWGFLRVEAAAKGVSESEKDRRDFRKLLSVGDAIGFKVWRLSPGLMWSSAAVLLAAMVIAAGRLLAGKRLPEIALGPQDFSVLVALLGGLLLTPIGLCLALRRKSFTQVLIGLVLVPGSALAWLHLAFFDPVYLARGKLGPDAVSTRARAYARVIVAVVVVAIALVGGALWWAGAFGRV